MQQQTAPATPPKLHLVTTGISDKLAGQQFEHLPSPDEIDRPDDLAVAIEMKFLLPLLRPASADPDPNHKAPIQSADTSRPYQAQAYELIAETIRTTGQNAITINAISDRNLAERDFWLTHWIVKRANSAEPGPAEEAGGRQLAYVWVPVEISSPKRRAPRISSSSSLSGLGGDKTKTQQQVNEVLAALCERHRLAANYTCEVHIHVGRMDGRRLALSTLKNLAMLLWLAEPRLRSIRDPKSPNIDNKYTWGSEMRKYSRLAQLVETMEKADSFTKDPNPLGEDLLSNPSPASVFRQKMSIRDHLALGEIWAAESHLGLGQLLSGEGKQFRRLGFNFSAFGEEDERARRSPPTVEFRMMEGTVESHLIISWLLICGNIIQVAMLGPSDPRFTKAMSRLLGPGVRCGFTLGYGAHYGSGSEGETLGVRRGREFRELMQDLGVPKSVYVGFEEKVTRDH
ncbi:hypothetical protein B0T25DRAFT_444196 [Lasiosphaeria hispida]|uniref:Uncharacterized protein n=1 Tax=Lasiosphaeria hispida TaxID=260671 RepID=A0AAJ0HUY6_9PEZI|nr:hypothetical protein B0T25DRAFT_444196 [Lasiosphaeria hispida]